MDKITYIFDLDGTVIDTGHRYRNNAEGHCDLDYWFANSTPEMIAKDALLPLARYMRKYYDQGHTIVICTARSWERHPLMTCDPGPIYERFLSDNDMPHHHLLYRNMAGPDHATLGDGDLKRRLLDDLAAREGWPADWKRRAMMFDDNVKVIQSMLGYGVYTFDALRYNERLARIAA